MSGESPDIEALRDQARRGLRAAERLLRSGELLEGRDLDMLREGARGILKAIEEYERAELRRLRIHRMREQVADGVRAHPWLAALREAGYGLELESEEGFVRLRARPAEGAADEILLGAIHSPTWWDPGEETLEGKAARIVERFAKEMRRTWQVKRAFEAAVRRAEQGKTDPMRLP